MITHHLICQPEAHLLPQQFVEYIHGVVWYTMNTSPRQAFKADPKHELLTMITGGILRDAGLEPHQIESESIVLQCVEDQGHNKENKQRLK